MKKILLKTAALLGAIMFTASSTVAYASEGDNDEGLVLKFQDQAMDITIPDNYEIVVDGTQVYRGKLGDYGIDEATVMESINSGNTTFDALFIKNNYFVESFVTVDKDYDSGFKNLSSLDEEDIREFGKNSVNWTRMTGLTKNVEAEMDDIFKTPSGVYFVGMTLSLSDDSEGTFYAYCMVTEVEGKEYYYYTRTYAPETDPMDLKEYTMLLANNTKFYYADKAEEERKARIEAEKAAAAAEASETQTVEEYTQQQVEKLKNDPNSSKTMGEIWEEQEKAEKTQKNVYLIGKVVGKVGIPLIILFIISIPTIIKKSAENRKWRKEHRFDGGDDDYNGAY